MKAKMLFLGLLLALGGTAYAADEDAGKHEQCVQKGSAEGLSGAALDEFVEHCMQGE